MNKLLATLAVLAMLTPLAAGAHGPPRKKVSESVEIAAPPERVWAVLSNFHDMSWLPPVEKTEGPGGNDIDATRKLTLKAAQPSTRFCTSTTRRR